MTPLPVKFPPPHARQKSEKAAEWAQNDFVGMSRHCLSYSCIYLDCASDDIRDLRHDAIAPY
jgi:hypothetical protein